MKFMFYPHTATTIEEVVDWFEARGAINVRLWRGPDGNVRGVGLIP